VVPTENLPARKELTAGSYTANSLRHVDVRQDMLISAASNQQLSLAGDLSILRCYYSKPLVPTTFAATCKMTIRSNLWQDMLSDSQIR